MVSFPKERISIYKCRDFRDPVIYTGAGLLVRVAAAPAGSACIHSVSQVCCPPGEQDRLGLAEEVWAGQRGCWAGAAHTEAEFSSHVKM